VKFNSDVMHLDGSGPEVRRAEERFYSTWGGQSNQAVFVVAGKTLEDALEANDRAYRDAVQAVGEKNFTSLTMLWPSEKTRKENVERWNRFWREGRGNNLKRLISEQAPRYRLREQGFAPFFENLDRKTINADGPGSLFSTISRHFYRFAQSGIRQHIGLLDAGGKVSGTGGIFAERCAYLDFFQEREGDDHRAGAPGDRRCLAFEFYRAP
jgi:hypothetical protein